MPRARPNKARPGTRTANTNNIDDHEMAEKTEMAKENFWKGGQDEQIS
jgi:hypothetical protein